MSYIVCGRKYVLVAIALRCSTACEVVLVLMLEDVIISKLGLVFFATFLKFYNSGNLS